jgi:HEAT repeat protein
MPTGYWRALIRNEDPPSSLLTWWGLVVGFVNQPIRILERFFLGYNIEDYRPGHGGFAALKDPDAIPVLIDLLTDDNPQIRGEAAAACTFHEVSPPLQDAAVSALTESFRDQDPHVRVLAAQALWRCHHEAGCVLPILTAALAEWDYSVRSITADTLGEMGTHARAAIPALLKAPQPNRWESKRIADALRRIDPDGTVRAQIRHGVSDRPSPNLSQ